MKLLGLQITRTKAADDVADFNESQGGWWPVIREGFAGAFQQNVAIRRDTLLAFTAVYACVSRISSDIGKMPMCLKEKLANGIWTEISRNSPYLPVLQKPNGYQTRAEFLRLWLISKLLAGNTFVLKQRDSRGIVTALYVLDPTRVRPMITPDGSVYYALSRDPLSEVLESTITVPSSEIIHDKMPALFHPLIGTSPIFACGLAAAQGHHMQRSQAAFFKNMAQPSGILTAPGAIGDETAQRLKKDWNEKFAGRNVGAVAVLGDGLKFEALTIKAADAQIIEQLKWSSETVCSAFSVPPYMIGVAPPPANTNIEAVNQQYWSQGLQSHITDIELLLTEGLEVKDARTQYPMCVCLNLEVLLRMDTASRFNTWKTAISGGIMAPNEARAKEDLPPQEGGDSVYLQVQNYSLAALAKRDAESSPTTPGLPAPNPGASAGDDASPPEPQEGDEGYKEFEEYLNLKTIESISLISSQVEA